MVSQIADNYRRRADDFEETIAATQPDQWANQSPCERWLARDIVAHLVEFTAYVLHGGEHKPTSPAPPRFDPLLAFQESRADMQRALDDPAITPERAEELDAAVSLDLPQHRWDLAVATGQDATMDAADLETLWTVVSSQSPQWWEFMRTPGKFGPGIEVYGPEVPVPPDSPLQDRLLGLLGRDPHWTPSG